MKLYKGGSLAASDQSLWTPTEELLNSVSAFAIFALDSNGIIASWNHGAEQIFHYQAHEVIGKKFTTLSQVTIDKIIPESRIVESGPASDTVSVEGWKLRKDGGLFWANTVISPLLSHEGKIQGFAVVIQDISEKHKREIELIHILKEYNQEKKRNNLFMQKLNESSVIAYTDLQGRFIEVNDLFCHSSGYDRSELIGRTPRQVKSGFHSRDFFKSMWETILAGKIWVGEICNKRKDGSLYWVYGPIIPILDEFGKTSKFFTIRQNITQKKDLESQLFISQKLIQDSLEFRRNILDKAGQVMIATDSRGVINVFNPAAEKLLGFSAEEVLGHWCPISFFKSEEILLRAHRLSEEKGQTVHPTFEVFSKAFTEGQELHESLWLLVKKDSSTIPVKVMVSVLRNKSQQIQGYLFVLQDRLEQRLLLNQLDELRLELNGRRG